MPFTRRHLSLAGAAFLTQMLAARARADTVSYTYDALGRLVRAEYSDGSVINYGYDKAGNRYAIANGALPPAPPPPPPFNQAIQITGASPVSLRTLADNAGFTGLQDANITYEVGAGITITGLAGAVNGAVPGGSGIDTGLWPTATQSITLTLTVKSAGTVRGGGGYGGPGNGFAGGPGGDAIYCRAPMSIHVNSGGVVQAGGGGGGGGGSGNTGDPFEPQSTGGGGGGGATPNGPGGPGGTGSGGNGGGGASATTSSGGNGGAGATNAGNGQAGGGYAASGTAGETTPVQPGGAGGAPGSAIRKNGHAVNVTNSGTITGSVG